MGFEDFDDDNFEFFDFGANSSENKAKDAGEGNTEDGGSQKQQEEEGKSAPKFVVGDWRITGTYLIGWLVFLIIFKVVYDRYQRKLRSKRKSWYANHPEKEAYEALITKGEEDEDVLRKALLKRAMTDIRRVWEMQEEKESLHKLVRAGSIPESMWSTYKDADNEMQLEIYDLQAEAETFKPGWSQNILKEAADLIKREQQLRALHAQLDAEESSRASSNSRKSKADKGLNDRTRKLAEQMLNQLNEIESKEN